MGFGKPEGVGKKWKAHHAGAGQILIGAYELPSAYYEGTEMELLFYLPITAVSVFLIFYYN